VNDLWIPDFYVINTANTDGLITFNDNAIVVVKFDGSIYLNIDLIDLNTRYLHVLAHLTLLLMKKNVRL
jgi:hypothetical protein